MIDTVEKMDINQDLERARKIIYEHDLTPIIKRMVLINRWSIKHATEACKQYQNYLFLKKKYGNQYDPLELPPSIDIDEFWHTHILHTKSYYDFCKKVFGNYFHHHPHQGGNSKITNQQLELMFEETQKLYFKEFGEYIYAIRPMNIQMKLLAFFENILEFLTLVRPRKVLHKS